MGHPRNHHTPPQKTDKVAKMNPEMPEKTKKKFIWKWDEILSCDDNIKIEEVEKRNERKKVHGLMVVNFVFYHQTVKCVAIRILMGRFAEA